jgi:predicted nucleotidyltransferase
MQFESAVRSLCDAGVDFVVIGGVAATFHGSVRVTYDLDIYYSRVSSNVKRLVTALALFHPRPRGFAEDLPFIWDEATVRNSMILTLQTDLGEIDLLAEVAGLGSYSQVKAHALVVNAFGRQIRTLDLRSLIAAKRAGGREKDLSALPELESLLEASET